jgi:hypothetical protein
MVRRTPFKFQIDRSKCVSCGPCVRSVQDGCWARRPFGCEDARREEDWHDGRSSNAGDGLHQVRTVHSRLQPERADGRTSCRLWKQCLRARLGGQSLSRLRQRFASTCVMVSESRPGLLGQAQRSDTRRSSRSQQMVRFEIAPISVSHPIRFINETKKHWATTKVWSFDEGMPIPSATKIRVKKLLPIR